MEFTPARSEILCHEIHTLISFYLASYGRIPSAVERVYYCIGL